MMWPWRVQTTSKATGSAFSIGFVNSYGQIGGAVGPQIFRSQYAPRYGTSFGVAMAMVGAAIGANGVTWWVTRKVEKETRVLKRARVGAGRRGEVVVDDVEVEGLENVGRVSDVEGGEGSSETVSWGEKEVEKDAPGLKISTF